MDQWLSNAASVGAKYAYLTTKHHDGFSLWPTATYVNGYSPYSVAQTSWYSGGGYDIVGSFVTKCRTYGLLPCLYYSIWDKTYETRSGNSPSSNPTAYTNWITSQLQELLVNYGPIGAIFTDGWGWHMGYGYVKFPVIKDFIRSIQPYCLLNENSHKHPSTQAESEIYETTGGDGSIQAGNIRPSEEINTVIANGNWFWNTSSDDTASSAATVNAAIANANANAGNYLLSFGPNKSGALTSSMLSTLAAIQVN
jgi:alpha-L-fucosidase